MEQSSILSKAYNCDCLEYMKSLPDNYFDLAIADPPYGIGASKPSKKPSNILQKNGSIMSASVTDFGKKDWDNAIPTQEFFDELRRVSKNQIIWGANYFGLQGGMIVWDKINGNSDQYDCEIAYQSFNKRTDLVHYMWNGMFQGKYCGRDIRQAAVQQGNKALNEKRIHPTQKPVILYEWLLNNYANKSDRIFDPMMGSQSSRIAAYRLGFDFVGCELDKEYFEKGCLRFTQQTEPIINIISSINDMDKISNEKSVLAPLTEDQWKVMSEIGYPYAPGNAKEHEAAPIPEMIYWRLAAGFITHEDAVRAFSTTGYTVRENPQRTREILSELNSQHGKLDADLNPLTNQSRIEDKKLTDAKAKLFTTMLEAQKDLGKELSISPTTVVYNKQKDIVCKINVEVDYENDELLIGGVNEAGNDISAYNMGEVLDNTDNVNVLKKAIHEAHINHLEQNAKLSIRDRIITPSARRFTPDQVEVLNRYHQVAAPDKPAGEVFKELLNEVAQEPEVARKPEKWVTDTAKELDEIAEGITRDQSQGLKR